jgi:hypothetical protein
VTDFADKPTLTGDLVDEVVMTVLAHDWKPAA